MSYTRFRERKSKEIYDNFISDKLSFEYTDDNIYILFDANIYAGFFYIHARIYLCKIL